MKISTILLGVSLLGGTYISQAADSCCHTGDHSGSTELIREMNREFESHLREQAAAVHLDPTSLEVPETDPVIEFDFDTSAYLPVGFDPYAGKIAHYEELDRLNLYTDEEAIDLGFDTDAYLPAGFNPFEGMESPAGALRTARK